MPVATGFFDDDEQPLWERLGYASEADYLNAQANWAKDAKEQRAREASQQHAAAGRDYGIIKRINKRIKARERSHKRYWADPEKWRAYYRVHHRMYYAKYANRLRTKSREYYHENREWVKARMRHHYHDYYLANRESVLVRDRAWYQANREVKHAYYEKNREAILAKHRDRYARNKAKILARQAAYRARKRAEQQRQDGAA